jgi:hypothetical protein
MPLQGKDVVEWLERELELDQQDAICIGRELLAENFISPVDPNTSGVDFRADSSLYYVRYVRISSISFAPICISPCPSPPSPPPRVSVCAIFLTVTGTGGNRGDDLPGTDLDAGEHFEDRFPGLACPRGSPSPPASECSNVHAVPRHPVLVLTINAEQVARQLTLVCHSIFKETSMREFREGAAFPHGKKLPTTPHLNALYEIYQKVRSPSSPRRGICSLSLSLCQSHTNHNRSRTGWPPRC